MGAKIRLGKWLLGRFVRMRDEDKIPLNNIGIGDSNATMSLDGDGVWRTKMGDYIKVTSVYSALITDGTIECTSGTFDVILYSAIGKKGAPITVTNTGSGTTRAIGSLLQTIQGDSFQYIYTDESMTFVSDDFNWTIV